LPIKFVNWSNFGYWLKMTYPEDEKKNNRKVKSIEQDALMSPNLCWKLEDPTAMCVLSSNFWLVNSHLVVIQTHFTLYLLENKCFLKSFEILTCGIVETTGCLTLGGFQNDLEKLCFVLCLLSNWNNRLFR